MIKEWKESGIRLPPSIIVENPTTINRAMRRKHYFFYEIIKDGILLYDDGTFQIGKPEKLPFREIKQYAEEEYAECFDMGECFLDSGHTAYKMVILNTVLSYYIKPASVSTKHLRLCIAAFALNLMN